MDSPLSESAGPGPSGRLVVAPYRRKRVRYPVGALGLMLAALAWWHASVGDKCFLYGPADAAQREFIYVMKHESSKHVGAYDPSLGESILPQPADQIERTLLSLKSPGEFSLTTAPGPLGVAERSFVSGFPDVPPSSGPAPLWGVNRTPVLDFDPMTPFVPSVRSWSERVISGLIKIDRNIRGNSTDTNSYPLLTRVLLEYGQTSIKPTTCTVYYAAGIDLSANMYPLVTSNESGIHPFRTSLPRVFASNGLTLVRLGSDAFKVYPTAQAAKYANAPVP